MEQNRINLYCCAKATHAWNFIKLGYAMCVLQNKNLFLNMYSCKT